MADVPVAVASTSPVELAPGNLTDDDQSCYVPRMFLLRSTENIPNHVAPCRVLFSFVPFVLLFSVHYLVLIAARTPYLGNPRLSPGFPG
jgi:hypothetical protein